jgi:ATP-dependent RNA helicase RhlE
MEQFRRHQIKVLVATDLAARGIDVSAISHIINYDIPPDPQVYVHRIGRTARMGARGVAITFVTSEQGKELTNVERLINLEVLERRVPGFVPTPPKPEPSETARPAPVSRLQAPVSSTAGVVATKAPSKTLGSRFRPSRRRRRL